MDNLKKDVDSIVKFVSSIYKPENVWVKNDIPRRYSIIFYFDKIDDKYIKNPQSNDIPAHKENMLTREIRTDIQNFFGIKTRGLQPPDFYAPSEDMHPIAIYSIDNSK